MNIIQIGCCDCKDEMNGFILKNEANINKFVIIDAMNVSVEKAKRSIPFLETD